MAVHSKSFLLMMALHQEAEEVLRKFLGLFYLSRDTTNKKILVHNLVQMRERLLFKLLLSFDVSIYHSHRALRHSGCGLVAHTALGFTYNSCPRKFYYLRATGLRVIF